MSPTAVDAKLTSLENRYTDPIRCALMKDDDVTAARLGASYDAKARRLQALRDPHLNPLRRVALRTLSKIA
jgi:hypothetical protein